MLPESVVFSSIGEDDQNTPTHGHNTKAGGPARTQDPTESELGDNARDVLLLPESDGFALHPSDRPDWGELEVVEDEVPEDGEHGWHPGGLPPIPGLRDDEGFELGLES